MALCLTTHLSQWKFGMWKSTASAISWLDIDLSVVNVHLNIIIVTILIIIVIMGHLDSGHWPFTMSLRTRPHSIIPSCRGPYPVHSRTFFIPGSLSHESKFPKFFCLNLIILPRPLLYFFCWVRFFSWDWVSFNFPICIWGGLFFSWAFGMMTVWDNFDSDKKGFCCKWFLVLTIWSMFDNILQITKYRNSAKM